MAYNKNVLRDDSARDIKVNVFADKDDVESKEPDKWNPTEEIFDRFIVRDYDLAMRNVEMALATRSEPMNMRELKECLLHSIDTIERVLASKIASGRVVEDNGKYRLVAKR